MVVTRIYVHAHCDWQGSDPHWSRSSLATGTWTHDGTLYSLGDQHHWTTSSHEPYEQLLHAACMQFDTLPLPQFYILLISDTSLSWTLVASKAYAIAKATTPATGYEATD